MSKANITTKMTIVHIDFLIFFSFISSVSFISVLIFLAFSLITLALSSKRLTNSPCFFNSITTDFDKSETCSDIFLKSLMTSFLSFNNCSLFVFTCNFLSSKLPCDLLSFFPYESESSSIKGTSFLFFLSFFIYLF